MLDRVPRLEVEDDIFERPKRRSRMQVVILSACALAALLAYVRLYFGVDLDDESFHIVVTYRYVLGARPFVDEVNLVDIGAGLLTYPFVSAYYHLIGLGGIVLFWRHLYFLFGVGMTTAVFFSLRTYIRNALIALPLSLLVLVFIPYNSASLHYNTFGNGFFTAGCFLGFAYLQNRRRHYLLLAGLTHGLAIFSYPTLALPVAVYGVAFYFLNGRRRSSIIEYSGVVAFFGIAWLAVLANDGLANARSMLKLSRSVAEGRDHGIDRALNIVRDTVTHFPLAPLAVVVIVGAVVLYQRRPRLGVGLLAVLPLFALPVRPSDLVSSDATVHYVANLGLLAVPLFLFLRRHDLSRRLMIGIWIPAFVAGWTISWSTFDGGGHQGLGFFPAAIVATMLLILLVRAVSQSATAMRPTLVAPSLVCLVPLAVLVGLQLSSASLHDRSPFRLHSRIESGPYAGLVTGPETKALLTALPRDLKRTTSTRCTILFYYGFPAGYLLTKRPPLTNTAFLSDREVIKRIYGSRLRKYYANRRRLPDLAVRLTRLPYLARGRPEYLPDDPIDALVLGPSYERVAATPAYGIYARRGGLCSPR
jgi:hypothetical protein